MIPSGLWLEGLSVTDEEIKNEKDEKISFKKIVLSGYSLEDSRIADFLINLENSALLENPVLEFGQKELDGGKTIFNFDISAKLR
jgi:Tfp pilus assembly protein PilN